MRRRSFASTLAAGLLAPGTVRSQTLSPLDVSNLAQLFVERTVVDTSDGVSFTLHPAEKHPGNPLIKKDLAWETWRPRIHGSVLYDDEQKLFRMWYFGGYPKYFEEPGHFTLYATSRDGINWEKPLVGTLRAKNGLATNAVMQAMLASVMRDRFETDPAKRYKATCFLKTLDDRTAYHSMVSPDGLNWKRHSEKPIAPGGDVITGFFDERRRQFVAFPKTHGVTVRGTRRRCFNLITSTDFNEWTAPQLVLVPDLRDDAGSLRRIEQSRWILENPDDPALVRTEPYGLGVYAAESCTIAFPWIFTINNNAKAANYKNQDGIIELQLGASRDLVNWERHFRTPCVARGARGEWDSGNFYTPSSAIRVGDEIWLYYTGGNFSHGADVLRLSDELAEKSGRTSGIGLAKWKLDRFVSVDGPPEGGSLTTVPMTFSGERLEVNAKTHGKGRLTVEILDSAGQVIAGYKQSDAFRGDNLRAVIAWNGNRSVAKLKGAPISLRFQLTACELYSFAFRS